MALTLEQRVKRLEQQVKKQQRTVARMAAGGKSMDEEDKEEYLAWQKRRVEQLVLQGMSHRRAKNKAWHEAQKIDFTKKNV